MPTYEYECTKCGNLFELEQRITERPRERCPECRGKVIRIISGGGGIILKGTGFYQTDYRSSQYKKDAAADRPSATSEKSDGNKKAANA
ncbi:MAG: zinc ribbon domain-containing protein [Candidatus Latescibacterota bacterium]|nr:MAG: zinc ribbon domain-containing protein [Candidatus Latescibacterota bacterium]